jgi:tetratricopeptide (TPR) repeat protein
MATFNKRGYKAPKEKEEKLDNNLIEDVNVDEKDSATAKAFSALDETASKTEDFVAKNQKYIFGVLGGIALLTVGYLLYQKFVAEPNQVDAADEIFVAQQNFQKAIDGDAKADSLFNLVLNGSEGKFGVIKIAEEYSGTDAGKLANYYAGISYLNLGKYDEAISSLEKFKSDNATLNTLAIGAIGDAYSQKNQPKEALDFYVKASQADKNEFTTPRFLMKAGKTALALGNKADALKYFTEIKEVYDNTPEGQSVEALIGLAQ